MHSQNYLMSFLLVKLSFVVSGVGILDPPAKRETPRRIPYGLQVVDHIFYLTDFRVKCYEGFPMVCKLHIIPIASLRGIGIGADSCSDFHIHGIDTVIQTEAFLPLMGSDIEFRQIHDSPRQLFRSFA